MRGGDFYALSSSRRRSSAFWPWSCSSSWSFWRCSSSPDWDSALVLCRNPFMAGNLPFGCGQCQPCLINRRRIWTWRMVLESLTHTESVFVTLTYGPDALPPNGTLKPEDARLWLHRLRKVMMRGFGLKLRFFLCGEYGDQTWRPHYHCVLFGVGVAHAEVVARTWSLGHVAVYEFNEKMAQYTAGYVVKKMTSKDDPRLMGRYPEFSRQSRMPGLGAPAMEVIRDQVFSRAGLAAFKETGDVPHELRIGRKSIPLGRYLRSRLRLEIGMPDSWKQRLTDEWSYEKNFEMLALRQAQGTASVKEALSLENLGKIRSVEVRQTLRRSRKL